MKIGFKHNLTGRQFGRLTVQGFSHTTERRQAKWLCTCSCGASITVTGNSLKRGKTQSCGCLRAELQAKRSTKHGMSRSSEYRIYKGMINRCTNPKVKAYPSYGGRGIKVCDRWLSSFEALFADVGTRPGRAYSLDRVDNDGNYEPGNVSWATSKVQANNSRRNRIVNVGGIALTLSEAVDRFSTVTYSTVGRRLRSGWNSEAAVLAPDRVTEAEFNAQDKWPQSQSCASVGGGA